MLDTADKGLKKMLRRTPTDAIVSTFLGLAPQQHGLRKDHSNIDATLNCVENILTNFPVGPAPFYVSNIKTMPQNVDVYLLHAPK